MLNMSVTESVKYIARAYKKRYFLYFDKVRVIAESVGALYLRPKRDGNFGYVKIAVGLCTLNSILPDRLCAKAGLRRKTSRSLRITCATKRFQNRVEEKRENRASVKCFF